MSGNRFKNAQRIYACDGIQVQREIISKIKLSNPSIDITPIGSIGHKGTGLSTHGDIDIAIKCANISELKAIVENSISCVEVCHYKQLTYIYSILYAYTTTIDNDTTKHVQVDFMLSPDIEYTKFRYYCPDFEKGESTYGVYTRILLWNTLLSYCEINGSIIESCSLTPLGFTIHGNVYSISPEEIIYLAFNENTTQTDVNTVEKLWDALHSDKFKYPHALKDIEMNYFVKCYLNGENLDPKYFKLNHWDAQDIYKEMHQFTELMQYNKQLIDMQHKINSNITY